MRGEVRIALGRELSKLFEEVVADSVSNILAHFENGIKGEIVCMVYKDTDSDNSDIEYKIKDLKLKGFKDKEISVILSTLFGYNKNEIYKISVKN